MNEVIFQAGWRHHRAGGRQLADDELAGAVAEAGVIALGQPATDPPRACLVEIERIGAARPVRVVLRGRQGDRLQVQELNDVTVLVGFDEVLAAIDTVHARAAWTARLRWPLLAFELAPLLRSIVAIEQAAVSCWTPQGTQRWSLATDTVARWRVDDRLVEVEIDGRPRRIDIQTGTIAGG